MGAGIVMEIRVVRQDQTGRIVADHIEPAHSFTRNFARGLNASFRGVHDSTGYTDATGVSRNAMRAYNPNSFPGWYVYPGKTSPLTGIIVGASAAEFSIDHVDMQSPILHGTGAGNLVYGQQASPVVSYDDVGMLIKLEISRDFVNGSESSVAVSEVGLMGYPFCYYYNINYYNYRVLLTRDVLQSAVEVPAGETLVVSYILKAVS